MKHIGLLTEEQKDLLVGQKYMPDSYFNPIQDANDNWVISIQEINQCELEDLLWIKELPLIEFEEKKE